MEQLETRLVPSGMPPMANPDNYSVHTGAQLSVSSPGVLSNDTDMEHDTLTAVLVSNVSHGTLSLNSNGSFTYRSSSSFTGNDSFSYKAYDGTSYSMAVMVTLAVTDTAPVANADSYTAHPGHPLSVAAAGVLTNDTDANGDTLTAVLVSSVSHGSLTLNSNGSFSYTASAGYTGTDSFQYKASDGALSSNTVTVTLNVTNTAPVAANDAYVLHGGSLSVSAAGVLANDTDAEGDTLTAVLVSNVSHGTLSLNSNGSFTFTPNAGFMGTDSFSYKANDGLLDSNVATVTLTGHAPVASDDAASVHQGQTLSVSSPGVLGNDSDADGDSLTAVLASDVSHGSLTLNSNGSFSYTPVAGFTGTDSFTYQASDGALSSAAATVTLSVTDTAPVAVSDAYTLHGSSLSVSPSAGVLANDSGVDGDTLTAVLVASVSHGSLTLNSDGSFTFTPDASFTGTDSFSYKANDGALDSNTVTVTITGHAPVASNDSYSVSQGQTLSVSSPGVLGNDSDPDADSLTAVPVAGPAHGSLTLNSNGSFSYTPDASYAGPDSFTYRASDGGMTSDAATVSITVQPVAVADSYSLVHDRILGVNVAAGLLANDSSPSGGPWLAVLVTSVQHGALDLSDDGSFGYTPAENYVGTDSFSYLLTDGTTQSNVATVSLAVTDQAPAAVDDAYGVHPDTALVVVDPGVLANDTDADGDFLTAAVVTGPGHGTLTLNDDGSFTYTPDAGFTGVDSFTYAASDGIEVSSAATVTLTVHTTNQAPVAAADSWSIEHGDTLSVETGVLANDSDADGDSLTAVLLTGPTHGTLTLDPSGWFVYTPEQGYAGPDSFTYQAFDGLAYSSSATVSLTVLDQAPVGTSESYSILHDHTLNIGPETGVLGNDSDADGDSLSAVLAALPAHGAVALNMDGSFEYTPAHGYVGSDTFQYWPSDGMLYGSSVTVNLTVTDTAPVAADDSYGVQADQPRTVLVLNGLLRNDTDADGDALMASLVSGPAHGTVVLNPDGSFTYTPSSGYAGPDSFQYAADDGALTSTATVSLTVHADNTAPAANADSYSLLHDRTFGSSLRVLANDTDADGDPLTASLVSGSGPVHGELTLNPDGWFTYTPSVGYVGSDSFQYTASDGLLSSEAVSVSLTVEDPNAPTVQGDSFSVHHNGQLTVGPVAGALLWATDEDGDALTASLVSGPAHGTLTLNPDGSFTYTPTTGYVGPDSFAYQVSDGALTSAAVTMSLDVINEAPYAEADVFAVQSDTTLTIPAPGVLANDNDPDEDPLTALLEAGPEHGTLTLNEDGSFTYTPSSGYVGPDEFTYRASDNYWTSEPIPVIITVKAANTAPTVVDTAYTVEHGGSLSLFDFNGVLVGAEDADGDPLVATLVSGPAHGSLTLYPDGSFDYTPAAGYAGADSFVYQAFDGTAYSASATASISVLDEAPTAVDDLYSVLPSGTTIVSVYDGVLSNDTDADDWLTAELVSGPTYGTLVFNEDGSFAYTPGAEFEGSDWFTYRAVGGAGYSAPATVLLTTAPVAQPGWASTPQDTPLVVGGEGVLEGVRYAGSSPVTAVLGDGPSNGSLTLNSDGSFVYTPDDGYTGDDTFTFRAQAGGLQSPLTSFAILTREPPTQPPYPKLEDDYYGILDGINELRVPASRGVLANDSTSLGVKLLDIRAPFRRVNAPKETLMGGRVQVNQYGSFVYTRAANWKGVDKFTYYVTYGSLSVGATVTIGSQHTGYISYIDPTKTNKPDIDPGPTKGGALLIGGGSDPVAGFKWMLKNAEGANVKGGDVVVLNARGEEAYNEDFWKWADEGIDGRKIKVNSIVTLGFDPVKRRLAEKAADDPELLKILGGAEAIFMQGGQQDKYVTYWKSHGVGKILLQVTQNIGNPAVTHQVTVGGTSAGMHALGERVYASLPGRDGVESREALFNPYTVDLGAGAFNRDLTDVPGLGGVITDTHFSKRDRMGRLLAFLAHLRLGDTLAGKVARPRGLAANEGTAILVYADGTAKVVATPDAIMQAKAYVYFVQAPAIDPEQCVPGQPLRYTNLRVQRITAAATEAAAKSFRLEFGWTADLTRDPALQGWVESYLVRVTGRLGAFSIITSRGVDRLTDLY